MDKEAVEDAVANYIKYYYGAGAADILKEMRYEAEGVMLKDSNWSLEAEDVMPEAEWVKKHQANDLSDTKA